MFDIGKYSFWSQDPQKLTEAVRIKTSSKRNVLFFFSTSIFCSYSGIENCVLKNLRNWFLGSDLHFIHKQQMTLLDTVPAKYRYISSEIFKTGVSGITKFMCKFQIIAAEGFILNWIKMFS